MTRFPRDDNRVPVTGGVLQSNGITPAPLELDANGNLLVSMIGGGNPLVAAPLVGQSKVASTGVAVRLNGGTSQPLTNGIIVTAAAGNNAVGMTLGTSGVTNTVDGTGNGYILAPGASISFAVTNTNDLYINGTTGDIVSWAGS